MLVRLQLATGAEKIKQEIPVRFFFGRKSKSVFANINQIKWILDQTILSVLKKSILNKRFSVPKWYNTITVHDIITDKRRHFSYHEELEVKIGRFSVYSGNIYSNCKHLSYSSRI